MVREDMRRLLFLLVVAAACGKNNDPPPPSSGSPGAKPESGPAGGGHHSTMDADAKAHEMFATVCAMCHGATGQGDGQAAAALNPKPRNYTDAAWQASVTDDRFARRSCRAARRWARAR